MSQPSEDSKPMTVEERAAYGRSLRKSVPRSIHGAWSPAADRPDPISLLQAQDKNRLQYLLPIKYGRMAASLFAFLRGSAVIMASDLAASPVTGQQAILCGDAHLSNFGIFATPERNQVFDINDFDEAYPGPWEWDLKRLAASAVVSGRQNGFGDKTMCLGFEVLVSSVIPGKVSGGSVVNLIALSFARTAAPALYILSKEYSRPIVCPRFSMPTVA